MTADVLSQYAEVWVVDFEFNSRPGERPEPVCLVARELRSGRLVRRWQDELGSQPLFRIDGAVLYVAYFASAEIGCHLALGWPAPRNILDLFTEFRALTNGLKPFADSGLIGAMTYFGVPNVGAGGKDEMRQLILRGGPWTEAERVAILDYCQADVDGTGALLVRMMPEIDLPRALLRGRYMAAVAHMEHTGIPIDVETLRRIERHREAILDRLIAEIDQTYSVYEGRTFKHDRFAAYLERNDIRWPQDDKGRLKLDDDTFRAMERERPEIAPLRGLRSFLSETRLKELPIGSDGQNRTLLSPFASKTGRNQPSTTRYVFGLPAWYRSLIKPPAGYGLAYIDYGQQEFGIGAALSGDEAMLEAYRSGDPYLAFAKQAGLAPAEATKATHKAQRERAKACILGTQYGMGEESLARRIGCSVLEAGDLLRMHRQTYKRFWAWSDGAVDYAMLRNRIHTRFGWPLHVGTNPNPRSLANFPMQANGAEMLRVAVILATEAGIEVCAPVHDALMIIAPLEQLEGHVDLMQKIMAKASRIVLDGFELRTEVEVVVRYPDRYRDPRGDVMWSRVMKLIEEVEAEGSLASEIPSQRRVLMSSASPSLVLSY